MRFDFDKRHVVEHDLISLHRPFVEHLGGDVFWRDINAFVFRLVQHVGEQPHLKLKAEDIHSRDSMFTAFEDDFLHVQAGYRQVDGTDRHQPPGSYTLEGGETVGLLGGIGAQDEVGELPFLFPLVAAAARIRAGSG